MKCHVLMPVGPGHEDVHQRALESVRIACEYSIGEFSDVRVRMADDTAGEMGRSAARNTLVAASDADWLFFLDADDLMHPKCFENVVENLSLHEAIWGQIMEYSEGVMYPRYQVPYLDSYESLIQTDAYLTLQMGHFVRRNVALDYPFDEDMNAGEDWDYYLRVWQAASCVKVDRPFMINVRGEHSVGPRAASGAQWRAVVDPMLERARQELEEAA